MPLLEAAAAYEDLGRPKLRAGVLQNLGNVYAEEHMLNDAEATFGKALRIYQDQSDEAGKAGILINLGVLYFIYRGERKMALEYWREARDLFTKLGASHMVEQVQHMIDEAEGRAG